ncbi:MAG: hypothetical protein A3F67_06975 [Verrucomicrobia bacterium RIFCSPHIGHO2_12_FULL_41_10]|nr:MAG: hypothetical protein A3F67_06975 [Verrucomicrobia bacterium RIFCSPHIGHO2_12_FULL_41_10]HLB33526.1 SCO family protein [Chthoniobacterales bacterium]
MTSQFDSNTPQPSRFSKIGWIILFLVVAFLLGGAFITFRKSERHALPKEPPIGEVPYFSFTTQEGKKLTKADLAGKIWVVDFIFTSCSGPCPRMTSHMAELASNLSKNHDVKLVSVSVDPENDTPSVLARYASNVQADPTQWFFLTGPTQEITSFVTQGMKQPLVVEPMCKPSHSTRFMIVDRQGMIRSYHDANAPEVVQKIMIDVGNLLREK